MTPSKKATAGFSLLLALLLGFTFFANPTPEPNPTDSIARSTQADSSAELGLRVLQLEAEQTLDREEEVVTPTLPTDRQPFFDPKKSTLHKASTEEKVRTTGWVLAPDGTKLPGVTITLIPSWSPLLKSDFIPSLPRASSRFGLKRSNANAAGDFTFFLEPSGSPYSLRSDRRFRSEGKTLFFRPNQRLTAGSSDFAFQTDFATKLKGQVEGLDGLPAEAVLSYRDRRGKQKVTTVSTHSGHFSFFQIMPGQVDLTLRTKEDKSVLATVPGIKIGHEAHPDSRLHPIQVAVTTRDIEIKLLPPFDKAKPKVLARPSGGTEFSNLVVKKSKGRATVRTRHAALDLIVSARGSSHSVLNGVRGETSIRLEPEIEALILLSDSRKPHSGEWHIQKLGISPLLPALAPFSNRTVRPSSPTQPRIVKMNYLGPYQVHWFIIGGEDHDFGFTASVGGPNSPPENYYIPKIVQFTPPPPHNQIKFAKGGQHEITLPPRSVWTQWPEFRKAAGL